MKEKEKASDFWNKASYGEDMLLCEADMCCERQLSDKIVKSQ